MKRKTKAIMARTAGELAEVLGLGRADGIEIAVRSAINTKIIQVIEKRGLTHAQVASLVPVDELGRPFRDGLRASVELCEPRNVGIRIPALVEAYEQCVC